MRHETGGVSLRELHASIHFDYSINTQQQRCKLLSVDIGSKRGESELICQLSGIGHL